MTRALVDNDGLQSTGRQGRELWLSSSQTGAVFDALPVAMIIANGSGMIQYVNFAAERLFESGGLIGTSAFDILEAADDPRALERILTEEDMLQGVRVVLTIGENRKRKPVELWFKPTNDERGVTTLTLMLYDRSVHEAELAAMAENSMRDELTGLPSRRGCNERGNAEYAQMRRYRTAMSVIIIDVDHFKGVNDTYGHFAGDAVLKEVAGKIRSAVREADFVGRWGGEEFMVILSHTEEGGAHVVSEKIRLQVQKATVVCDGQPIHVTVSLGTATHRKEDEKSFELLCKEADGRLYQSKRGGRNRTTGSYGKVARKPEERK